MIETVKVKVKKTLQAKDEDKEPGEIIKMKKSEAERHKKEGFVEILDKEKEPEEEKQENKIELGPMPTGSLGVTVNIGGDWKMEISKPEKRYLVVVKGPDGKKLHELDYPENFWAKQRKRKTLESQIKKAKKIYGEDYDDVPETNEKIINDICLLISENIGSVKQEKEDGKSDGMEPEGEILNEEDVTRTSKIETENLLAEQIVVDGKPKFAFLNGGDVKVKNEIFGDSETFVPRNDEAVKSESVLLPTGVEEYEDTKSLLEEIREIIHDYVDVSEMYERLASWYVMTTWVYDELSTLSYLRALGDTGTGKSRLLDVVGRLCYKPIIVSGAVTPAPIYRLMEQWMGTLIIDEGDIKQSDAMNEVVTILNCGFERGRPVIRCTKDDPDNIQFHRTFGPKLIATRQEFNDKALESRCLTEKMSQTTREDLPDQLPDRFYEKAKDLRNKLLRWRFDHKGKVDVERSRAVKMGNLEPRLKQATRSFLAVFEDEEIQEELLKYLEDHQRELVEQRARTWEGIVINIIYEYWKGSEESLDKKEPLWSKKIAEDMENDYGVDRITPQKVGKIISGFDLETKRKRVIVDSEGNRKQKRCIVWDDDKLKGLFKRYVPELISVGESVTAVTFVTGGNGAKGVSNGKESFKKGEDDSTLSQSEGRGHPKGLSQPSHLSQELTEVKRLLSDSLARTDEDISDELDLELKKVRRILSELYDAGDVEKKPAPNKEDMYYHTTSNEEEK